MTAHAPTVSRTLAAAGFDRAETESTSIRGYVRYYPGFEVTAGIGSVTVRHNHMDSTIIRGPNDPPGRPWQEVDAEHLEKYAAALTAAGYTVRHQPASVSYETDYLVVTR